MPVLSEQALAPGWQTVEAQRAGLGHAPRPEPRPLDFAWAASPRQVFPDPASRAVIGGTGVVSPVNLDVHSFR